MIEVKLTGLDGVLATLQSLPAEVVSKRGGPVKTALRKGAVVVFKQARANLETVINNSTDAERKLSTGLLLQNLVVTRGKPIFGSKGERYLVRVRRKSYNRKGASVTTLKTAHLLEYGSSKQTAEPWLRPAGISKHMEAINTVQVELVKAIDRVVKKLAKQNKAK